MDILLVLISSIISGVLGVIISTIYYKKAERRKEKIEIIKRLFGNRHDLKGEKFTEALNSIVIIFHDSDNVISKLKLFHDGVSTNTPLKQQDINYLLIDLFKALIKDVNLETKEVNDTFFLKVFNIKE